MRPARIDDQSPQSQTCESDHRDDRPSLLTPARRAALDALERELQKLIQTQAAD